MARPLPRPRTALAAVLAAMLGVTACSGEPQEPVTPDPVTVSPDIEERRTTPPEPEVPVVWPLTGVAVEEVPARPAVAVKVENTSSARPQSGLESADVVWETVVEFHVSRLIAVFHSQYPEEVGPIRSVRPMDGPIVAPLKGVLAFSGGQGGIISDTQATGVQTLSHDAGQGGMYRVRSRRAPHNVYADVATFAEAADGAHSAAPAEQFVYALDAAQATAAVSGTAATSVAFRLSDAARPSWAWDAGSGRWLRSEGGAAHMGASGSQLSAVNVVAVTAPHPATRFRAQGGERVPTYDLVGEGVALVATGGRTVTGTWRKAAVDAPLQLFTESGDPLMLAPGNTWVELVPEGKGSTSVS